MCFCCSYFKYHWSDVTVSLSSTYVAMSCRIRTKFKKGRSLYKNLGVSLEELVIPTIQLQKDVFNHSGHKVSENGHMA